MRNASESQFAFDIFERFAISARDEETIATEGEKHVGVRFRLERDAFEKQGVSRRGTHRTLAFYPSVERGENGGEPDFRKRESESRDAGCLCVSQHARTQARLHARTPTRMR